MNSGEPSGSWRETACRYARTTHAGLGIAGLLLLTGLLLAELLDLQGEGLEAAGSLLAIPFALALFGAVPLSAAAVLLCWGEAWLVLQSLAHLLFVAVLLLLGEEHAVLTTASFAGYVAIVLYGCWRRRRWTSERSRA